MAPYWIVVGDIHSEPANLEKIPGIREAAGVIVTGDLTQFGGAKEAEKVLNALRALNKRIVANMGNLDNPEVRPLLEREGVSSHGGHFTLSAPSGENFALIGLGGSNPTPFKTPTEFSEEELEAFLEKAWSTCPKDALLVLSSHTPPVDTACDRINAGAHVGSKAVRAFIEKRQPALCLCGHVHEAVGKDKIGNTVIVNPGALFQGGYARLEIADGLPRVALERVSL